MLRRGRAEVREVEREDRQVEGLGDRHHRAIDEPEVQIGETPVESGGTCHEPAGKVGDDMLAYSPLR